MKQKREVMLSPKVSRRMVCSQKGNLTFKCSGTIDRMIALTAMGLFAVSRVFAGTTEFTGGDLNALKALSPTLTFDHLLISGHLRLPAGSSTTLRVNDLTISGSGSVGSSYTTCQYDPAPNFTVEATGQVILNGPILLNGRSGTRVSDPPDCNQCGGQAGGHIRIAGNDVRLTAEIESRGGSGSTSSFGLGSIGCSGGNAGPIHVEATNLLILDGAALTSRYGSGGTGYSSGQENHGANGASAEMALISHNEIQMTGSTVTSSGTVVLQAQQASIYGPISGQLQESINGQSDTSPPTLEILTPRSGEGINLDSPLAIRIATQDGGAGIKEVRVNGFGHDEVHSGAEIEGGVLTVTLPVASWPYQLEVTVTDNKGLQTTQSATNFVLQGNLLVPAGSTYVLGDDLSLGTQARMDIRGRVLVPLGRKVTVNAGTLVLAAGGVIEAESPTNDSQIVKTSGLTINLSGLAIIRGLVDFNGVQSLPGRTSDYGQSGGRFTLEASDIEMLGTIRADGGRGTSYYYGSPPIQIAQLGGNGGWIRLFASNRLEIEGTVSVKGGRSFNVGLGPCGDGGAGGVIELEYGTEQDLSQATCWTTGGDALYGGSCSAGPGNTGVVLTTYKGAWPEAQLLELTEVEPNGYRTNAQYIPLIPVRIAGSSNPSEQGEYVFPDPWVIQDLYELSPTLDTNMVMAYYDVEVGLTWLAPASLDLLFIDPISLSLLGQGNETDHIQIRSENLTNPVVPLSSYWIGVQALDSGSSPYTLTIRYADQPPPGRLPNRPVNQSPGPAATEVSLTPTLLANSFRDLDLGDSHLYSHWLVYRNADDTLVFDSGWDATHKTSLALPPGILSPGTEYRWRVSYADNQRMWSRYSEATVFTTTTDEAAGPRFVGCQSDGAGGIALHMEAELGRVLEIHASSNLTEWSWLATLTNTTGQVQYTDPVLPNHPLRFYKALQRP